MIGVLITGHGNFATGIVSSLKLVFGEQELMRAVDFTESQSTEELRAHLEEALDGLGEEVLILCDLKGGSPYNQSVILKRDRVNQRIEVLAGTNLAMLLSASLGRGVSGLSELTEQVMAEGRKAVERFELREPCGRNEADSDGI